MERDGKQIPFMTSGPYSIRGGNAVRPLVDGEPAFRRSGEAIEAAQRGGAAYLPVYIHAKVASPSHSTL